MTRVLLLCTANQCRSPMGEAILRRARPGLEVRSAGRLPGGAPATPTAVDVLARRGLDLSEHVSRTVTPALLEESDLIVGMAREHVRDAVLLRPDVRSRAFALKDLVRRAEAVGPRRPDEQLASWLAAVGQGRTTADLLGSSEADDVVDPIGRPAERYRACADELTRLLDRLAALAFPEATEPSDPAR
jgi:protein-tyrosine phosphatase